MTVRPQVTALLSLGRLPSETGADVELVKKFEEAYKAIARPLSAPEARLLISVFGDDSCFGLAPSLMHLIETAPGWPFADCLIDSSNVWIAELRRRAGT